MDKRQPGITPVHSAWGAPMGRRESYAKPGGALRLFRVRINRGGYDSGGAYWGIGAPLFCAFDPEGDTRVYVRASCRRDAAQRLARSMRAQWPEGVRVRGLGLVRAEGAAS